MPICHKYKCIFIHIPKTGGTSVVKLLTQACGAERAGDCMDYWGKIKKGKYSLTKSMKGLNRLYEVEWPFQRRVSLFHHLPAVQLKSLVEENIWNTYTKFAVIRNPFDRWVSFYEYYRQTGGRQGTDKLSFREWFYENDFSPLTWPYVTDNSGNMIIDKIIKFEDLKSGINNLKSEFGIPDTISLGHEKKTKRNHYSEYFDEDMQKIASKILKKDLKLFNYEFENKK